jgi:hypothetical protein
VENTRRSDTMARSDQVSRWPEFGPGNLKPLALVTMPIVERWPHLAVPSLVKVRRVASKRQQGMCGREQGKMRPGSMQRRF